MRNISFALTTAQVLDQSKDVTRRLSWRDLTPGTVLQPVKKAHGIKKGEHPEKLGGPIRVVSVRQEPLRALLEDLDYGFAEVRREGFAGPPIEGSPSEFVDFFRNHYRSSDRPSLDTPVTRIEFEYIHPRGTDNQ